MKNTALKIYVRLRTIRDFAADACGQDLIEYVLVAALIALAATAGMSVVATKINTAFENIGTKLETYTS